MAPRRIATIVIASGGLGCLCLLVGCGDESRTTGTHVEQSPQGKIESQDVKAAMEAEAKGRKLSRAAGKKQR